MLQIVASCVGDGEGPGRGPWCTLGQCSSTQGTSGRSVGAAQVVECPLEHESATGRAGARTDLDHLVRPGHHRGIVFDDQHAVTTAAEVFEQFDHRLDIARVQPHRRFVDHVGHLGQARSEVSDRLDALRFAAGQARGRAGERQVPESDLHHGLEPFSQRGDHRRDVGGIDGVHEVEEFCDLETGHLARGATEQDRGAGGFVQPVAVAFGTGLRPRETADGVLFAFGQIVGGVQVDAFESRDDALVLLRCLAA